MTEFSCPTDGEEGCDDQGNCPQDHIMIRNDQIPEVAAFGFSAETTYNPQDGGYHSYLITCGNALKNQVVLETEKDESGQLHLVAIHRSAEKLRRVCKVQFKF